MAEMVDKPELIYFNGPGRAELARLAFHAGGVEFTDTRIEFAEWPALKADPTSAPGQMFGSMPVVKHGNLMLAQSIAVAQYAADLGINSTKPPTVQQRGIDTMMLGAHADVQSAMYGCIFGDEETKAKNLAGLSDKVRPLLEGIERQFGDGPFLYSPESEGPTLGDLAIYNFCMSPYPGLVALGEDIARYPKMKACVDACALSTARPGLQAYLTK